MRSSKDRMARLEALEQAQQPDAPPYLCVRSEEADRLNDPAVLARYGLVSAAQLPAKIYVGFCVCSWDDPPGRCPVCMEV